MQSWGVQSRFSVRDTGLEPSKSGVIGLLCAALGRPRHESVADLADLKMGVRVDAQGVLRRDYQTAGGTHLRGDTYGVRKADGGKPGTVPSSRYYLADASFLVGLEGKRDLLEEINDAIEAPVWQLSLGRKSYVPSLPVRLPDVPPLGPGIRDETLEAALREYPWNGAGQSGRGSGHDSLRLILESDEFDAEVRRDVPLSFATRQYSIRTVVTRWIPLPQTGEADVSITAADKSA
jgi:CRISPR system Cascade subunit CasD